MGGKSRKKKWWDSHYKKPRSYFHIQEEPGGGSNHGEYPRDKGYLSFHHYHCDGGWRMLGEAGSSVGCSWSPHP